MNISNSIYETKLRAYGFIIDLASLTIPERAKKGEGEK